MKQLLLLASFIFLASCHKKESVDPSYLWVNWTCATDTLLHVYFTETTLVITNNTDTVKKPYSIVSGNTIYIPSDSTKITLTPFSDSLIYHNLSNNFVFRFYRD